VKSWDGGKNAIDSDVMERDSRKRGRDLWDEELDQGKVCACVLGGGDSD